MEEKYVPFKVTIEGQEIEALMTKNDWELALNLLDKNNKKTGYERVKCGESYWGENYSYVNHVSEDQSNVDNHMYTCANYYSDRTVAENNVRADNLMRQLRRFAVEHRKNNNPIERFYIYCMKPNILQVRRDRDSYFVGPWFDSLDAAAKAIKVYHDDLIWYFTEYKDSL